MTFNFDLDLDFDKPGWCTPTILAIIVGIFSVIAMSVQLAVNKDQSKNRGLITAWVINFLWTIVIVSLLFWLCSRGKSDASWWIFGLLYLVPIALMILGVVFWMYFQIGSLYDKQNQ